MNTNCKLSRRFASVLLLSAIWVSGVSAQTTTAPDLTQRVEAARTPADYEALATYYDQQATASRGIAAEHRKMAKSYQGMVAGGRGGASMTAHCNAIATKSDGLAKDYEAMAAAYRQMAKQAKP
ncbi:MAG: hypothetical protein J0L57_00265 [Burkholderiales bacterium]|jgi:hypothetical protein|nr:hypothetical protein [Burkholderiales bacterium]